MFKCLKLGVCIILTGCNLPTFTVQDYKTPIIPVSQTAPTPLAQPLETEKRILQADPLITLTLKGRLLLPQTLASQNISPLDFVVHLRDAEGKLRGVTRLSENWEYAFPNVETGQRYLIRAIQISHPTLSLGALTDLNQSEATVQNVDMTPYSTAIVLVYEQALEQYPELLQRPFEQLASIPELARSLSAIEGILVQTFREANTATNTPKLEEQVQKTADILKRVLPNLPPVLSLQSPTIAYLDPGQGHPGETIRIGVQDIPDNTLVSSIKLGEFSADILSQVTLSGLTVLTVRIPPAAKTAPIFVKLKDQILTSQLPFQILPAPTPTPTAIQIFKPSEVRFQQPPPTIEQFSPLEAQIGEVVTVIGQQFINVAEVKIGQSSANFNVQDTGTLTLTIPVNASSAPIAITTAGGTVTSLGNLSITSYTFNGIISGLKTGDLARITAANIQNSNISSGSGNYQLVVPKTSPLPGLSATWQNKPVGWGADYTITPNGATFVFAWPLITTGGLKPTIINTGQLKINDGSQFHPTISNYSVTFPPPNTGAAITGSIADVISASQIQLNLPVNEISDRGNLKLTFQNQVAVSVPYDLWHNPITVGNGTISNSANASQQPVITINGSNGLHLAWSENNDIRHNRSTDSGATWAGVQNISNTGATASTAPTIATSGSTVYLAWTEGNDILFNRSTDSGATWAGVQNISNTGATASITPTIAASGSTVYLAWTEGNDILFNRSTDSGATWAGVQNISNTGATASTAPTIAANHLAWVEGNEILYSRSADSGMTWGASQNLSASAGVSVSPSISADGANVSLIWQEVNDPVERRSSNSGVSWSALPPTKIAVAATPPAQKPSVSLRGTITYACWHENGEIFYSKFVNGETAWTPAINLSSNTGTSLNADVVIAGDDKRHIVWQDNTTGTEDIYYRRRIK